MEYEYMRVLNKNYAVYRKEDSQLTEGYQLLVLCNNCPNGLLPFHVKKEEQATCFCYEITSFQCLERVDSNKKIGKEWVTNFVFALEALLVELEKYLMDSHNILLRPRDIFRDIDTADFYFVFYPYYEDRQPDDIGELLKYLVEQVDGDVEEDVDLIYGLYESWSAAKKNYCVENLIKSYHHILKTVEVSIDQETIKEPGASKEVITQEPFEYKSIEKTSSTIKCFWQRFFGKSKKEYVQEQEEFMQQTKLQMEEYGKTVYFEAEEKIERKLYGTGKQNRVVIKMDEMPFTIGKKKELVHFVLSDGSISRIHVRFTEVAGDIFIEDLNSTNGTFKNSFPLTPYEKVQVEKDDEIRLGRLEFVFR